ncbi:hypothetical protein QC762_305700 [Podospora pseudocomata]|uniref:Heterokaryon incompatibility domain-containing protein n=1 Tax=Podospora pseudocomata TaxID=2093779 RepID=A0ABR0GJ76_9PEZI|nr:hypothetical protein QC762_305700 [Podospora pseudocomata]
MAKSRKTKRQGKTTRQIGASKRSCSICQKIILAFTPSRSKKRLEEVLGTWKEVMVDSKCQQHKDILLFQNGRALRFRFPVPIPADTLVRLVRYHWDDNRECRIEATLGQTGNLVDGTLRSYSFVLLPSHPSDNLDRYGRLIHAHWIDSSLFRRWKTDCDQHHQHCKPSSVILPALASIRPAWLVDIVRQCLVPAQLTDSYVCLSYVWGGAKQFTTAMDNLERLQQPNALSFVPLAKTITHAMAVVEMAGEKFLWVDALCIVQDDDKQKHQDVQNMSGIYANATFTIIARSATNADSGLPGLFGISQQRKVQQHTWRLGPSSTVINIQHRDWKDDQNRGAWFTRGWTFQEELFSRRQLVLREHGPAHWTCMSAQWREDIRLPDITIQMPSPKRYPYQRSIYPEIHNVFPNIPKLAGIIENYNRRSFTLPEDSLRAFSGIATALLSSFQGGLISGLPADFFYAGLLWFPFSKDIVLRWPGGIPKASCVPSWSWAAWKGSLDLKVWRVADTWRPVGTNLRSWRGEQCFHERIFPIVEWSYHTTSDGPGIEIKDRFYALKEKYFDSDKTRCPPGWTRRPWTSSRGPNWVYNYHDESRSLRCLFHPIHLQGKGDSEVPGMTIAPWISCYTRSATLLAAEELIDSEPEYLAQCISLRDSIGTWAGFLTLNPDPLSPSETSDTVNLGLTGKSLTLVEVARGEIWEPTEVPFFHYFKDANHPERPKGAPWYQFYWVMWVEWRGDIAYRRGLGRVVKSIWEAQDRKKMHLMLG